MPAFPKRSRTALRVRSILGVLGAILCAPPLLASPLLRCETEYAGSSEVHDFVPTSDPYRVKPIDIAGRFRFKAVVIGDAQQVAYVKIYTDAVVDGRSLPVQQASYRQPVARVDPPADALSGRQVVRSPYCALEFHYACALHELAP